MEIIARITFAHGPPSSCFHVEARSMGGPRSVRWRGSELVDRCDSDSGIVCGQHRAATRQALHTRPGTGLLWSRGLAEGPARPSAWPPGRLTVTQSGPSHSP